MQEKIEGIIKNIYRNWKARQGKAYDGHPSEEDVACFLEGKLSSQEQERLERHFTICAQCAQAMAIQAKMGFSEVKHVPEELLKYAKGLVSPEADFSVLEVFLKVKDNFLEILSTTGNILLGQEPVPAPALRSRKITEFKDEVIILKDFKDISVELKVENKQGGYFNLNVMIKKRDTQEVIKDLRVTLIKDDTELESYLGSSGKVVFEHVLLGKYKVEICNTDTKVASVLLEIKT